MPTPPPDASETEAIPEGLSESDGGGGGGSPQSWTSSAPHVLDERSLFEERSPLDRPTDGTIRPRMNTRHGEP